MPTAGVFSAVQADVWLLVISTGASYNVTTAIRSNQHDEMNYCSTLHWSQTRSPGPLEA